MFTRNSRRGLRDITNATNVPSDNSAAVKPSLREPTRPSTERPTSSYQHSGQVDNIDARDANDPLCATEYVREMYQHFRSVEASTSTRPTYMKSQPHINEKMRSILVDWLVEVHLKFKLVPETLYLCVNIIDRYLERAQVSRSKLQLLGVTCLLLAAKYEEIYPPEVRDLVYVTDKAYTRGQILKMESSIVNTLGFKLTVPTHYKFLVRFIKAAQCDTRTKLIAYYFCEKTLCDYSMLKYKPSTISAAAVYLALKAVNTANPWTSTLQHYSKYDLASIMPCAQDIVNIVQGTGTANLQAINKKYSQQKFGDAAGAAKTVKQA